MTEVLSPDAVGLSGLIAAVGVIRHCKIKNERKPQRRRGRREKGDTETGYLKDNELWVIGGWRWLERRLICREMMQREKQKREGESAQLDFLSVLGFAA